MGWKTEVILGALAGLVVFYITAPNLAEVRLRIGHPGGEVPSEEIVKRTREYRIALLVATLLIIVVTLMQ